MSQLRTTVIRAGLEALYRTGAHHLLRPIFAGVGAMFMLHHVRPGRDAEFQPNRHLEVEPSFLRKMLAHLRARDVDIITMDELHRRLDARDFSRRFACFTLDDGYRDNRDYALPVRERWALGERLAELSARTQQSFGISERADLARAFGAHALHLPA